MRGYYYDQPDRPSPAELALDDYDDDEFPIPNGEEAFVRIEQYERMVSKHTARKGMSVPAANGSRVPGM